MKQIKTAFTLVELIVVITILSVLSTVAFISFQWYTNDARDATKISDLVNIWRNIWNAATAGKQFRINNLQDITYASYPENRTMKIWELTQWVVPGLWETPLDPFTWKPYIVWLYANSDNTANFWQIGGILENRYGEVNMLGSDEKFPANVPVQRIVWNYRANDLYGISGLIPRWAIEDFEWFKNTWFYALGEIMYGVSLRWLQLNSYLFAMDRVPVVQITWYTDEKTLIYESYENVDVQNIWEVWNPENYPRCTSPSISQVIASERISSESEWFNQVIECSIDRSQGVNSNSSLYLSWLFNWNWDGQYHYTSMDKDKKYQLSMDLKWTMDTTLRINYVCYGLENVNNSQVMTNLWWQWIDITLDPNNFQRINAYVNSPDPSGNGLSVDIQSDTNLNNKHACIFYRVWDPKAGEELYFDNYIAREID